MPNSIIFNLVVCDLVNLIVSMPLHYFFRYNTTLRRSMTVCRIVFSARHYLRTMSAFAVVALSIKRCISVMSSLQPRHSYSGHKCRMTTSVALCILAVWLLPLVIALPPAFLKDFYNFHCSSHSDEHMVKTMVLINALLYCVVLPSVMCLSSMLTARRLKLTARNMPGEIRNTIHEHLRMRSAKVMMVLAVVFVFSYFPFHIMIVLIRWVHVNERNPLVFYTRQLSKHLLFANGCLNPIALYTTCGTFRELFLSHVCCSVRKNEDISRTNLVSVYTIPMETELKCIWLQLRDHATRGYCPVWTNWPVFMKSDVNLVQLYATQPF
jgi:hypothetical protein